MADSDQITIEPPASGPPSSLPLALAFEVVRRLRQGELQNPREWVDLIVRDASPQRVLQEAEWQLEGKRPIDLGYWVMEDMPSHEARFIDDEGDLLEGACIAMLIGMPAVAPDMSLKVGASLVARREKVLGILDALRRRGREIGRDYRIADVPKRITALRRALVRAFDAHDRGVRAAILSAHINSSLAEELIRGTLEAEWAEGFPRALFESSGAVVVGGEWDRKGPALTISNLELKEFFLEDRIEASTMQMMGSAWGRAILDGEASSLVEQLKRSPARHWRLRSLDERIRRAKETLQTRGYEPTHLIGPSSWRLWREMVGEGALGRVQKDGRIGSAFGLIAYQAFVDLNSVVVVSLPGAVQVDQRLIGGKIFEILVREITEAVVEELRGRGTVDARGGPGETPSERIRLRTWVLVREVVRITVEPQGFVRVAIPESLRD